MFRTCLFKIRIIFQSYILFVTEMRLKNYIRKSTNNLTILIKPFLLLANHLPSHIYYNNQITAIYNFTQIKMLFKWRPITLRWKKRPASINSKNKRGHGGQCFFCSSEKIHISIMFLVTSLIWMVAFRTINWFSNIWSYIWVEAMVK